MRHGFSHRKLSRSSSHRKALLRNLVSSLIEKEQIKTTVAKAKETKKVAEKIISIAKRAVERSGGVEEKGSSSLHLVNARKRLLGYVRTPGLTIPKLISGKESIGARYGSREGGYTRLRLLGHRMGDYAPMAVLELVGNPRDLRWAMTIRSEAKRAFEQEAAAAAAGSGAGAASGEASSALETLRKRATDAQSTDPALLKGKDKIDQILTTNFRKAWKSMNHSDGSELLTSIEKRLAELRLEHRLPTPGVPTEWKGLMDSKRAERLTRPTSEMAPTVISPRSSGRRAMTPSIRSMPTLWPRKGLQGRHPWIGSGGVTAPVTAEK